MATPTAPEPTTFLDYKDKLDKAAKWAVETLTLPRQEDVCIGGDIAAAILRRQGKAVSDGSYKNDTVRPRL